MNLAGLFQYGNKNTDNRSRVSGKGSVSGHVVTGNSSQAIKGLTRGQSIQGEIVGKNGNEVQIRVDKDVVITAKLDRDISVSVGQNMTFEVKNSSGTQIALRPLYENLAQDANAMKALEAAKLPATDDMMQMVSAMMKQGMSIDKNALLEMGRAVMSNAGANIETVVMMKALNLPVTPENIQQFENYQNYKHQLLSNVTDIFMEIPNAYQSMTAAGWGNMAVDFYTQILNLFSGKTVEERTAEDAGKIFMDIVGEKGEQASVSEPTIPGQESTGTMQSGEQAGIFQDSLQAVMENETLDALGGGTQGDGIAALENSDAVQKQSLQPDVQRLSEVLDTGGREQLAAMLEKLGMPAGTLVQIAEGKVTTEQLMKEIQQLVSKQGESISHADLMKLFGSKEYNQLLTKVIEQQWLMKPEQVSEKKEVEAFYGKLRAQTEQLMESLHQIGRDTPLAKSLTMIQNNIDFMNQMNQMYQYIQLPLKMSGGDAHGDLYVYANRKSMGREDGSVSALLHLDMEHLGPMDIHVLMKDTNVSTKFYLQDESMIDFIAEHIHLLNERLQKRGYSFQSEMLVTEKIQETVNVIETLTAQEKKATLLAQYSFDVRA